MFALMSFGPKGRSRTWAIRIVLVLLLAAVAAVAIRRWARHEERKHFVSMGATGFELRGEPFFPLIMNYVVAKRLWGDSLWLGTCVDYQDTTCITLSPAKDHADLAAHLELVREMGFNTVRLVGCSNVIEREGRPYMPFYRHNMRDSLFALDSAGMGQRYLDALEDMMEVVHASGLKVILHVGIRPNQPSTEEHFTHVADRLAADTTVMAYDLFNEPLYFDPVWREKTEVNAIGEHWRALMRVHAPRQLWTVGLANLRETLEWDPAIINADFFSFHPYEHEPLQVLNETYWYAHHCPKPWIVGETSIPADNDSVPWSEQADFARSTLRQALSCGAWGYSWWQFKDVDWHRFHPNFMGAVDRLGETRTRSGRTVVGSVKPVGEVFRTFDPAASTGQCECPSNYYNWTPGSAYRLTGRLVGHDGQGLPDGVILAWDPGWSHPVSTVTRPDGTFQLITDTPLAHWTASAPYRTRLSGAVDALKPDTVHGGLTQDLGVLDLWFAPLGE